MAAAAEPVIAATIHTIAPVAAANDTTEIAAAEAPLR